MSNIIDRIGEFAHHHKLSIRKIENRIGASNGTISKAIGKDKDIQTKWIALFVEQFPEVNPVWLLTGSGSMNLYKTGEENLESKLVSDPQPKYENLTLKQNQEIIESLKQVIAALEGQLREKERIIELKDRIIKGLEK